MKHRERSTVQQGKGEKKRIWTCHDSRIVCKACSSASARLSNFCKLKFVSA